MKSPEQLVVAWQTLIAMANPGLVLRADIDDLQAQLKRLEDLVAELEERLPAAKR